MPQTSGFRPEEKQDDFSSSPIYKMQMKDLLCNKGNVQIFWVFSNEPDHIINN